MQSDYQRLKQDIRRKAKQYLSKLGYNPDLVDTMDCYADKHEGFLAVYPDIEPKGLTNDMETLPIPLIYYYADDDRFEITDAGMKYLKKSDELLLEALDKGIDDMEAGRLVPHKEAVKIMKQRLRKRVWISETVKKMSDEEKAEQHRKMAIGKRIKVIDRLRTESTTPVLVCDLFSDDVITNRLKTDIGIFEESSFAIGDVKECFSQPTSRTILLRTDKDCSEISEVEFV